MFQPVYISRRHWLVGAIREAGVRWSWIGELIVLDRWSGGCWLCRPLRRNCCEWMVQPDGCWRRYAGCRSTTILLKGKRCGPCLKSNGYLFLCLPGCCGGCGNPGGPLKIHFGVIASSQKGRRPADLVVVGSILILLSGQKVDFCG